MVGRMGTHLAGLMLAATLSSAAVAQETAASAPAEGPVTHLPLPRFVSLKATEAYARRGPSTTHRIDWVFQRRGMPLVVVAEYEHWRRVVDRDGQGGWVYYTMLTGTRSVLVEDEVALQTRPDAQAPERARLEPGVVARLDRCDEGWCALSAGGYKGWAPQAALWGADLADLAR